MWPNNEQAKIPDRQNSSRGRNEWSTYWKVEDDWFLNKAFSVFCFIYHLEVNEYIFLVNYTLCVSTKWLFHTLLIFL